MSQHLSTFQNLLRELFQFDSADLDFGIYRIMNFKRDSVEKFITQDLPQVISAELARGALVEETRLVKKMEEAKKKVLEISEDAFDASGNLIKYRETKPGQDYLRIQEKAEHATHRETMEITIYNHLYTFFNRYWQDGDFISKRRYSKRERYSIPYNGEEVMLYWANHDQYYIKTGEYFTDYTWKATNGLLITFKLTAADVEQDNVQGDKRFFLPCLDGIVWDEPNKTLILPFEYRPLTEEEVAAYGQRNQQDAVINKAVIKILQHRSIRSIPPVLAALAEEKRRSESAEVISALEYHLRRYTRRNTSDFFIHKDLKGFLSRELDFYLKNEVLNLETLELAGEHLAQGWFQMMRLIKKVGNHIIEFLAQIEEFQKMLWEKRKFVTESFYCITMGNIPEEFYPEIVTCEAQWHEWEKLCHIDEEETNLFTLGTDENDKKLKFLKSHPTLVLDTRHFPVEFVDRLLASYDNLDEAIDGLLVHSENWQALNLLAEKYYNQVEQIHVDPPYNTDVSGFLYKNDYRHSSWLSMITDRLRASRRILNNEGVFTCHIDENEYERLCLLLGRIFGYVGTAIWDKLNPMMGARELAVQHEYILFCSSEPRAFIVRPENVKTILSTAKKIISKYNGVTEQAKTEFTEWVRNSEKLSGGERAYQFMDDEGRVFQSVSMAWPNPNPPSKEFFEPLIHPATGKPCPVPSTGWSRSPGKMKELLTRDEIIFGRDESIQPRRKVYLSERKALSSVIRNGSRGKTDIDNLGLDFTYNHPVSLYTTLFDAGLEEKGLVLDYFAGSGTTGHAVINLNREDGGQRKFILVEMAHYFDTVLLPRIKKVTFAPEWRDGKPRRMATLKEAKRSPRIMKIIRLESYEDTLNNITFDELSSEQALQFEDYLLQYMLQWETRKSETMLNVEKLNKPFSYQLHIHSAEDQAGGETKVKRVDIPETFAYLLGLSIEKRQVHSDGDRRYLIHRGITRDGRKTAVIWRETEGWTESDYGRDKSFVFDTGLIDGVDDVYVNGDSLIPAARALETIFKERMFTSVEV